MSRVLMIFWVTAWLFIAPSYGQVQSYYFKHFETDDGLINNSINTITQDHNGFLWIGTRGGLTRFDGYTFKTIDNDNNQRGKLWNNFITSIAEDKYGLLWIGTGHGMFRYDPRSETFTSLAIGPQLYINGFVIDERNDLWILGQNQLYFYDRRAERVEALDVHVSRIALNFDGNLLLGNYDGMFYTCDRRTRKLTERRVISTDIAPNMRAITEIYPVTNDLSFIGYKQGLITYDIRTNQTKVIPLPSDADNSSLVRDIIRSKKDEFWIATERGLYIYDRHSGSLNRLTKKQGDPYAISDNSIYAVFKDRSGDMWVGTYFGGLNYHSRQNAKFTKSYPVPLENSLSGNAVSEIWADKNGQLYIGTEDAGLNRFDSGNKKILSYTERQTKNSGFYTNIHGLTGNGKNLYIGSYFHGMQIMDRRKGIVTDEFKIINEPGENGSEFVLNVFNTRNDEILVGTIGDYGGLYRYDPLRKKFSRFKQLQLGTPVYHIAEDHEGKIWAGLRSQTAFYLDPRSGRHGKLTFGDPADESSIHYILEDSEHALWFSTIGAGLIKLAPDRKTFKKFTVRDGLPSDVLYGMLEDDHKRLWIGSTKGLICLDIRTNRIITYKQANGLITNQFNFNSACKALDGRLYFGSVKGLISFDPNNLLKLEPAPQIHLTGFQINSNEVGPEDPQSPLHRSITFTDTIILGPDQRNFSIEFAALNFSSTKATRYLYRMTGLDRTWTYSNTNRKAYFTDLAPGRYTFTVKAKSNVDTWESKERRLYIKVLPPFWLSGTAYFLYSIFGCLSIFLLLRYYHTYQKKRNEAKLKLFEHQKEREVYQAKIEFFTHIAHEIQTPLTLISVPVARVLNKAEDYPTIKKSLVMISKYTKQLIDLTTHLLDFRQTEIEQFGLNFVNVDIGHLLHELTEGFQDLASENKITLKVSLPRNNIVAFVDREAFSKICSNLITNAIKYAATCANIDISISDTGYFSVSVSNDGKAIPEEYQEKIFEPFFRLRTTEKPGTGIGLSLARSLTELHNGSLTLASGKTDHIIFILTLPLRQQYEFNLGNWKKIGKHEG